jgi:hypothetical protein
MTDDLLIRGGLVFAVLIFGAVLSQMKRRLCDMCGNPINRTSHKWSISGEEKVLCPHCNQEMRRKISHLEVNSGSRQS